METFLYLAYGSNMLTSRLRQRCPSAKSVGITTLPGYQLKWHKRSKKDGSGKCDMVKSVDSLAKVHGVLYEISTLEKQDLDRAEGLGHGYEHADFEVILNDEKCFAIAYIAIDIDSSIKPLAWYRKCVVDGAKEHGLPAEYIAALEVVDTIDESGDL